ncbi:MAG TPA: hypothetical protein VG268_20865 [Streptosporangiaceae bacterium]|nr:hypothetical protein [Streptosporangiaceae bacterium]
MITAVAAGTGHPVVAGLLGLGSAGLAASVVAMTWSVHARQIRLAEVLARRQFIATTQVPAAGVEPDEGTQPREGAEQNGGRPSANGQARAAVIDGPEAVVTGEQARYRVRSASAGKVVSWAVGGGSVAQTPDPSHPDELLLIADQPGSLTISVRVREGMTERRETKAVAVIADVPPPGPPFTLRLFLHGWGLVVAAILIAGFAGALAALGTLTSSDFVALVAPITALLGMAAVVRGMGDSPARPAPRRAPSMPGFHPTEYPGRPATQPYVPPPAPTEPVNHN